jgi:hypothetical protein
MKAVLWRRFCSLESKKKVATVYAQNPQGTKANMRSSWADSIAGDEYVAASNRPAFDINSYQKKLGSSVTYGKSMHTENFSSPKLKPVTSHTNYGEKLSSCTHSSLVPKKKCLAIKEEHYVDNLKWLLPIKKKAAIITSDFSSPKQFEKTYASSIVKASPNSWDTKQTVATTEKVVASSEDSNVLPTIYV